MRYLICVVAVFLTLFTNARAQSPNATLNGQVVDSSGGGISSANVDAVNVATNIKYSTKTNGEGMYLLPDLPPANYEIQISHTGFKTIVKPDVLLNVRDAVVINFTLPLGAVSERVTVEAGAPLINTQDAAVSTVVDRQFAENLPMNGRSFQTLIQLTPGVVLTASTFSDGGQFSVNGQRASSNYWTIDGVSANIGMTAASGAQGNGAGGALAGFSALGGTNNLVSVDALQEFRIQTSTFAPEFGRMPGGQISIVTRSGTNRFHGTLFDYLRNDALDAKNWFNGFTNNPPLPKAKERQNDFGGTFSGPLLRNRTFFFFSYEGLRLRLPQTTLTTVPSLGARQAAIAAVRPFLNAFPQPNGAASGADQAQFNASYSNPSSLDATSLRIDHGIKSKVSLFARYNYSPSALSTRASALSRLQSLRVKTQTATGGATWMISSAIVDDVRVNYSRNSAGGANTLDSFGGATPLSALDLSLPPGFSPANSLFTFSIFGLAGANVGVGRIARNVQRQFNITDTLSSQRGKHSLKFGVDYRRLMPIYDPLIYQQQDAFSTVPLAERGTLLLSLVAANRGATLVTQNLGLFAQDTWRINARLTATYGLRWDLDFAPSSASGPSIAAATNFNDLTTIAFAPAGTPPFATRYGNLAPRIGLAFQLSDKSNWQSVIRGGFGMFYDIATQELGNALSNSFPFSANRTAFGGSFPLSSAAAAPPAITTSSASATPVLIFDPHLELPYTLQWNAAFQQSLGAMQSVTISYVGAVGRRLIQTGQIFTPNPGFRTFRPVSNDGTSDFHSLQLQFHRRLSHGLQTLASYSWAHSIDTGSASSIGTNANGFSRRLGAAQNRGPSDFDIRQAFSAGITYNIPTPPVTAFVRAIARDWSVESVIQARSAPPVEVFTQSLSFPDSAVAVRPDLVPGAPLYISDSAAAGGRRFNPAAFVNPPVDPATGRATRQGTLGRNALRAFDAAQWDLGIHRDFPVRESLALQFRAELFNVLNHPNFGSPVGNLTNTSQFGRSVQMLGQFLNGAGSTNLGGGAFSPLYQIGGPRSIQVALRLTF